MNTFQPRFVLVLAALWAWGVAAGACAETPERPNFIVILCDDLGYGDLGCYGHPVIQTPHLNQLARTGIRLTDCYSTAPVCSPSRVGLLTGRSPNRAGVYDWIPPASKPRPDRRDQVHMQRGEATIATQLKKAGYETLLAGKWHCNSQFNSDKQPQPNDFGFDHWMATQNNAAPSHRDPVNFVRNGKPVPKREGFSCQLVVDEVSSWLERRQQNPQDQAAGEAKPFFMFLPFHEPHEPVESPPALVKKYLKQAENEDQAQYFANVENVDRAVGRLLATLEDHKLRENTLIIFTSDNGPETLKRYRSADRSYGRPGPLRGMKLWTTDAGFRVAGIINWPGKVKPAVSHQVVSALDFLPTFCAMGGAELPDRHLDGVDISTWLLQGEPIQRKQPLVWAYYNSINRQRVAMRDGPWKMLAQLDGGDLPKLQNVHAGNLELVEQAELTDFELYRVDEDIDESENLIDHEKEVAARLKARLNEQYRALLKDSHIWK